jgi:putative ABC transport system permease protein
MSEATNTASLAPAFAADLRQAFRGLARAPGFALVAILTLATGIGATTAIFSAVYAVVLRPLPFREPERLVRAYAASPATTQRDEVDPRTFAAWRRESRSFERMAAIETRSFTFADGARLTQQATGVRTTADFFPMLGIRPLLGRTFTAEEDRPGSGRVMVLSHRFWNGRLGGEPGVVGRTVRLDGVPFVVIGVMPASFDLAAPPVDLWTPIAFTAEEEALGETGYLDVIARLRDGVTIAQARDELAALTSRLEEGRPTAGRTARLVAYEEDLIGAYRARLFILLGAVGFVLLIACANVANLMLARGAGRAKELAIRSALGAGRGRIVRQLLTESLVLGALGGAAGLVVAFGAVVALKAFAPTGVPRLGQSTIDVTALIFTTLASLASALAFGLVPALRAGAPNVYAMLKAGGRSSAIAPRDRVRQAFVAVEVAFSLVLLVGAGLLIRSAIGLQRVDPGLEPANLWTGAITLPPGEYSSADRITQTVERIADGVRRTPGVRSAAVVSVAPFTGLRALGVFVPEGRSVDPANMLMANFRLASPDLFRTLGVSVNAGRDFSDRDAASSPPVAIVNEAFARLAWGDTRVLGKRLLGPGGNGPNGRIYREIVGVVADMREDGVREEPRPAVYYPLRQVPLPLWGATQNAAFLVARTGVDPLSITDDVQRAVSSIDRGVPVYAVRSMEQRMAEMLGTGRFNTMLLATLGVVGLLLATVGVYGVIAHLVGLRRQEIGVRMALGATPMQVVALVVGQGLRPVLIGIAVGAGAAVFLTRVLASQLFGVAPTDPLTFAGVALALIVAAAAAAAIPARSAARVDPRTVLGT